MSPTDDIHVNPADMHAAAAGLAAATNTLSTAYSEIAEAVADIGGMAGSDPAARDWGNDFDTGLTSTLNAHFSSIAALANCAELVDATATNHLNADGASVIGNKPPPETLGIKKDNLIPNAPAPPPKSAGQPDNSEPAWWRWIKNKVGDIWPNGHQDKLHSAATALRAAASGCHGTANAMTPHIGTIKNQVSPEIDPAVHTLTTLQNSLNELGNAYSDLASACDDHAHHIDEAHSEMEEAGAELLGWTIVDFITDGAASGAAGRVATRIVQIYEKFKKLLEVARIAIRGTATTATRLQTALKPIAEALSKIRSFGGSEDVDNLAEEEAEADTSVSSGSNLQDSQAYAHQQQQMEHVFVPKHKLDGLVTSCGGEDAAMDQMIESVQGVPDGIYGKTNPLVRTVNGHTVTIRGAMINGVFKVSTAFIP